MHINLLAAGLVTLSASAAPPQLLGTAAWPMTERQYATLAAVDPELAEVWASVASLLTECAATAQSVCGEGQVCYVCVYENSCSYGCRAADGSCQPAPPCGPPAGVGGWR